jgi:hypothetical protein
MAEKPLEFSLVTFTSEKLEIKVKNTGDKVFDRSLAVEFYPPKYLVSSEVNAASVAAATNEKPIGVATLEKVVARPEGWSVWAKREASDSSVVILLLNDMDGEGNDFAPPVKLAPGAEFVVSIPLNPRAGRANVNLLYSYQHGNDPEKDARIDGQLELKAETTNRPPDVTLTTNQASPTAIPPATLVKIFWHIEDGVSATLRGPLPEGNSELTLSPDPGAVFKLSDGFVEVRVVGAMTYLLQAVVKRDGQPNVEVVRMLSLDTNNKKHLYVWPRPSRVLPHGLIEIDWAAWGVEQVQLAVGGHTTRTITLTQQTLGRFYEGSGVMRVSATRFVNNVKTIGEAITIDAPGEDSKTKNVQVISWVKVNRLGVEGHIWGLAVIAPKIALLTFAGLYIAEVGRSDPAPENLAFKLKTPANEPLQWAALTAVEKRFVCLRRRDPSPDFELAPVTPDGNPDPMPPATLPPDIRNLALSPRAVFDLVGFGKRAYFVVEAPPVRGPGIIRRAFSVGFDGNKSDLRPEPLLEPHIGFRLVSFDNGLYALNRTSGQMLRFDLTKTGTLDQPKKAAGAVKKIEGGREQSMIADGLPVPLGRVLVVLSPTSVPSIDSLQQYGLQNTLNYTSSQSDAGNVPQDLVYNPQKDYWARCGHDLDVKPKAVAAFRGGDSTRLWVMQPDGEMYTLAVGSESLFAHDYVPKVPTKPLPPYVK